MTDMVNLIHSGCQQPNLQFFAFYHFSFGSPVQSQHVTNLVPLVGNGFPELKMSPYA